MNFKTAKSPRLIVFSDLDGTLLDHDSYSWEPARPAIEKLAELGWPLVLASSKTGSEIAPLRAAMGFDWAPAIVENGAGILPAGAANLKAGGEYARLRAALDDIPRDLRRHYEGFGDWTVEEVAMRTGLPHSDAASAAQRQFSEPGIWSGPEAAIADFSAALADFGITARQGGRFLTLSFGATKADRMVDITSSYTPRPATMALGDAPNDIEMIEQADDGVIIRNDDGPGLPKLSGEATGRVTRSVETGPTGWNTCVLARIQAITNE